MTGLGSYAASDFDFALILALRAYGAAKPDAVIHRLPFLPTIVQGKGYFALPGALALDLIRKSAVYSWL